MRAAGFLALALFAVPLSGCLLPDATPSEGPLVVASVYPVGFFAARIAGDDARVLTLVPAGVEPHDWEPSPRDLIQLEGARLLAYNGAGLEPWVDRIGPGLAAKGVDLVEATRGISTLEGDVHDHGLGHEEDVDHAEDGDHAAHETHTELETQDEQAAHAEEELSDPHVWLDPVRAPAMVDNLLSAFVEMDPANATAYATRAEALKADLDNIHTAFVDGLATCATRDVLVTHAAFGYLAHRYNFTQWSISGLSPEVEPSPARIAELVDLAWDLNVTHVYFETLVSPRVAEVIAEEVGAQTLVLNPLEGLTKEEQAAGADYFTVQEKNLQNLRTGMACA